METSLNCDTAEMWIASLSDARLPTVAQVATEPQPCVTLLGFESLSLHFATVTRSGGDTYFYLLVYSVPKTGLIESTPVVALPDASRYRQYRHTPAVVCYKQPFSGDAGVPCFSYLTVCGRVCDCSVFLLRVSLSDGSDSESSSASSPLHHEPPPPLLKTNNNQVNCGLCTQRDSTEL